MEILTDVDGDRIRALRERDAFFWLDLKDPADAELDVVGPLLGLHELAMEDSREFGQRAKLDRYPEQVLLVYWSARVLPDGQGTELVEVHLHISGGFLFTVRRAPSGALDELHRELEAEEPDAEAYVLYRVLDALTDALYPVVDDLESRIDALEAQVLADTDRRQLSEIHGPSDLARRGTVISFALDGIHPHDVAEILGREGVCVRAGHHCAQPLMRRLGAPASTRASFAVHTTHEDVDRLIDGFGSVRKIFD